MRLFLQQAYTSYDTQFYSGLLGVAALYQKLAWNYFTQTLFDSKKDYF